MRLATLNEGGRDGTLVVVSSDLERAVRVPAIAPTLQAALEDWSRVAPMLRSIARLLDQGAAESTFPFKSRACLAPLPRAYQWMDGSAYIAHIDLMRRAYRINDLPPWLNTEPLIYQGGSDILLGPRQPIPLASDEWGLDYEAEVAVITTDVPMGVDVARARQCIALVLLANDLSLRNLMPHELAKGFGFFQSKPPTAFSPVAAAPDSLGARWDGDRLIPRLRSWVNDTLFGEPWAGRDMLFGFPQLIVHAARTRPLSAGTIIGSGTVANLDHDTGCSCIAERRILETFRDGKPATPYLRPGDRVRIQMIDETGNDLFGAIDQEVVRYTGP
jgi:fumarylacetoacetate (FAA) hydrolase